jgi:hypothetical protein
MITPMRALSNPPQSKTSSSPIPSPAVKIAHPTIAPTRPKTIEISHERGLACRA